MCWVRDYWPEAGGCWGLELPVGLGGCWLLALLLFHCVVWPGGALVLLAWPYAAVLLLLLLFQPLVAVAVSPPPTSRRPCAIPHRVLYAHTGMCSGVWLLDLQLMIDLTLRWWAPLDNCLACALLLEEEPQFGWWPFVSELCKQIKSVKIRSENFYKKAMRHTHKKIWKLLVQKVIN